MSSANSLAAYCKLSGRSFMYIKKSNKKKRKTSHGPKIEPCKTSASTDDELKHWPLSTTHWNLLLKKL